MCGILLHATTRAARHAKPQLHAWWKDGLKVIADRGPDACSGAVHIDAANGTLDIDLCASVLALRGEAIVPQPIYSSDRKLLLLWNGEAFVTKLAGFDLDAHDGEQLISEIERKIDRTTRDSDALGEAFTQTLSAIEGPYAAVLLDTISGTICFARDPIGRRSLLVSRTEGSLTLVSATCSSMQASKLDFYEVDCASIWTANLNDVVYKAVPRLTTAFPGPAKLVELKGEESSTSRVADPVERFCTVLSESVRNRVQHLRYHGPSSEAQIAVLFSGGLDCCTIALLAHQHLPPGQPIDLLNVAFQNPRVLAAGNQDGDQHKGTYEVPDRITSRASLLELQHAAPDRQWTLVEVNVPYEDYVGARPTVEALMAPCTSVMDLSIAAALYFAARAKGTQCTSTAKVLLSGLGADELLGGYSRHRKAFRTQGKQGLVHELQMDLDRLPTRNLGRDDRIISASGKECRYPFLSHAVIHFLAELPVEAKMNLELGPGTGDKKLLRMLAHRLGLVHTSTLTKRAIQFGARSAKMDAGAGRIKGHEQLPSSVKHSHTVP